MQTRVVLILGLACLTGCGQLAVLPNGGSKGTANGAGADSSAGDGNNSTGNAGDANSVAPIATDPNSAVPSAGRTDWLTIKGSTFYRNGQPWIGRGVTLHDTRSCDTCTSMKPNVAEVKRRIDEAVTNWNVNFFRLLLEQYPSAAYTGGFTGNRVQWDTLAHDPNYLHDIEDIVQHIGSKPGVYVMVSLWKDPGFTTASTNVQGGLPTAESAQLAATLAQVFQNDAHVMIGVANEPESNYDGAQDASCLAAMNSSVAAIRKVEDDAKAKHHIVAVQGTAQWGRTITYYVQHQITTDGGDNVAYETHPYTPQANFQDSLLTPAKSIPVIIGEFGPADPYMTLADAQALMNAADAAKIPWAAWDFHTQCNTDTNGQSNMLLQPTDQVKGGNPSQCIPNKPLLPTTDWGVEVQTQLKKVAYPK